MRGDASWSLHFRLALTGREIAVFQVDKQSTIREVRDELRRNAGDCLVLLDHPWSFLYQGAFLSEEAVVQHVVVDAASIDVMFCSQARVVVTASSDCTARAFDLDSGDCLELQGHFGQVYACTMSADHCHLVTASEDKTARVWALDGWQVTEQHRLCHGGEVYSAVFSNCGSLVATASQDGTACLWCSRTGKRQWQCVHAADVYLATFSHDDQWVLTSSAEGAALIVLVRTGEVSGRLEGHGSAVNRAEFSPVGTMVVTASDNTVRIWEATASTCVHTMGGDAEVKFVDFSRDGELVLATRSNGNAEVWCVESGKLEWTCTHHSEPVYMATSCPRGAKIALASEDGSATLWSRAGELLLTLAGHADAVTWISFSPSTSMLVTASWDGTARLWSTESGDCLEILEGHAAPVLYAEFGYLGG